MLSIIMLKTKLYHVVPSDTAAALGASSMIVPCYHSRMQRSHAARRLHPRPRPSEASVPFSQRHNSCLGRYPLSLRYLSSLYSIRSLTQSPGDVVKFSMVWDNEIMGICKKHEMSHMESWTLVTTCKVVPTTIHR